MTDYAKATFWGVILIFSLITLYFWVLADTKSFLNGLISFGFLGFISWLGIKLK